MNPKDKCRKCRNANDYDECVSSETCDENYSAFKPRAHFFITPLSIVVFLILKILEGARALSVFLLKESVKQVLHTKKLDHLDNDVKEIKSRMEERLEKIIKENRKNLYKPKDRKIR